MRCCVIVASTPTLCTIGALFLGLWLVVLALMTDHVFAMRVAVVTVMVMVMVMVMVVCLLVCWVCEQ